MAAIDKPVRTRVSLSGSRPRIGDLLFRVICTSGALVVAAIVFVALQQLASGSWSALQAQGLQLLYGRDWDVVNQHYGALALIFGTLVSSIIALLIGGTTGVMISAFLVELAPRQIFRPVSFVVDLLAAIPSIIFGLWGVQVLVPWLRTGPYIELRQVLGWTHLFGSDGTPQSGFSLLTAGIVLGVMIIPTVAAITREMLLVVPVPMRDGALALGARRTEALKGVMIPYAIGGILGGLILGLGRALGETMAVSMLVGNMPGIQSDLLHPGATLSSTIAVSFGEADANLKAVLIGLGLILFILTLSINIFARVLVARVKRRSGVH